ncbi:MAG TPA: hypothetical protein DD666_00825 [Advenella kashmirensis]|uniref:Uncharacterized protein n=1 Tax=Advenella kashmirensis TaxID=310575 RepID=A0A356LAC6_9BURK|nr:hypothetical protein [Advenella kashmirensis]
MDKKSFIEQRKPKVTAVPIDGQDIYLREPTIGDNNFVLFEKRAYLLDEAIKSGVELDLSDEAEVEAHLKRVPDKFALARGAAIRICDPDGNLLFDAKSKDDLAALNSLGESLLSAIQEGTEKKKG